jgi:predicted outer membrane protein
MLTSGNMSNEPRAINEAPVVAHNVTSRWTDQQIVAALAAAQGPEADAKLAREKSKSARVERFTTQIIMDQRELGSGQVSLSRNFSAQQSAISARAGEAQSALSRAIHATSSAFDKGLLDAEIDYCHTMLDLVDKELLPSATSSDVKSYLQNFRAKTASRLLQAQEIQAQLP